MGFTPNIVTTIGFIGNLAAAAVLCCAGYMATLWTTNTGWSHCQDTDHRLLPV